MAEASVPELGSILPRGSRLPRRRRSRAVLRPWHLAVRRVREAELTWVLTLGSVSVLLAFAMVEWPRLVPVTALLVPLVVANAVLAPRLMPWLVLLAMAVCTLAVLATPTLLDDRRLGGLVVVLVVSLIIMTSSLRRSSLGVAGARGESMLVDLRERLTRQSRLPELPEGWYAETALRPAGGGAFAGDFVVAGLGGGHRLDVAVIDVSGKGEQAGTRSLLLSGALGGLLGALPPDRFLPAANDYLLRQEWDEGFATAVHLSLDLVTGDFELRSAGHPPAVQLSAGSGRWAVHDLEGPVLGLIEDVGFACLRGHLSRGDALLLYTDGLVETAKRDISSGIDKLVGRADRLLRDGFDGGADRMLAELESSNDDQALLLLHRRERLRETPAVERMTGIEPA